MPVTTFEIDPKEIAGLQKALDAGHGREMLDNARTDILHVAEGAAKDATPYVTGHARRSTVTAAHKVVGRYPYLDWLDKGEDTRGRKMQTRPGGYRIRAAARSAAEAAAPAALDKAGREIADRFASA